MRKILMLATAYIRKSRPQSLSLAGFIALAAATLNLALLLLINYPNAYDVESDARNAPHFTSLNSTASFGHDREQFVRDYPGVSQVTLEPVLAESTLANFNGADVFMMLIVSSADRASDMDRLELSSDSQPLRDGSVYLSSVFRVGGGYEIGDKFVVPMSGEVFEFTVAGFSDDVFFNATLVQWYRMTVTQATFERMQLRISDAQSVLLGARLDNPVNATQLALDYQTKFLELAGGWGSTLSYESIKSARTFMATTMSLVMAAVALIVVVICLVVLRFRVRISIGEQMSNIGALKAIGYTSRQISASIVVQNLAITMLGLILGIGASYALLPALSSILEVQSALKWHPSLDLVCLSLTVAVIAGTVALVVGATASSIRKLAPLTALRSGLEVHSFTHNSLPLSTTRGPLNALLAFKSALQAKGQMAIVAVIVAASSFTATAVLSIYYNMGVDNQGFVLAIAGEMPDVGLVVTRHSTDDALEQVRADPQVRKAFERGDVFAMLGDKSTQIMVTPDYSAFEGTSLFEGRYPLHRNEIAVSAAFRESQNLRIGDSIDLKAGERSATYLVTGLLQSMTNGGYIAALTNDGVGVLVDDYAADMVYVYLHDPDQAETWGSAIVVQLDEPLPAMIMSKMAQAQLSTYGDTVFVVALVIVVITGLVIVLVLYSVLNTAIAQKSRYYGVAKSLGFTSAQLTRQVSLTYMPVIAVAVVVGCILGYLGFLPLVTALFSTMGIYQLMMSPSILTTAVLALGLVVFAYVLTTLVASKVRRASAYSLVIE